MNLSIVIKTVHPGPSYRKSQDTTTLRQKIAKNNDLS